MPTRHSASPQLQVAPRLISLNRGIPDSRCARLEMGATYSSTPSPGLVGHFGEVALTIGFGRARLSPPIPQPQQSEGSMSAHKF